MGQLDRISIRQLLQVVGQLFNTRHLRSAHEHRDDRYIAPKCRSQLYADEVIRVVEAASSGGILCREPLQSDNCQKDAAVRYALVDCLPEVTSRLNRRHIHKHRLIAEVECQVVEEATCLSLRVVPAIVYEDGAQGKPPEARA
jgi:hypothetical protein